MNKASIQAQLQPVGRRLSVSVGRAMPGLHMKPSFLICGAQRCGTTSMYQALRQHPAVLRPTLAKGVHYFDTDYVRGMGWYRAHFPFTAQAMLRRRKSGHTAVTFESSPYYLFHPLSAGRIAADLPGVKIISLLRDPVERAYSAHTHEKARGFETESFERALELEPQRLAGEEERLVADPTYVSMTHQHNAYVTRGHYVEQVQRMERAVGTDRLLVLDAEDFFTDPLPVWQQVVAFLGLPDARPPVFDKHNARPRAPMSDDLHQSLRDGYQASDERLAAWWGKTPSWRR